MRTQLFRKVKAIAGWSLLAGVLMANAPSFGDEPTPSATSAAAKSTCCDVPALPMLARIPYLNRLFKNQPIAETGEACFCVDDVRERIGVDFDFIVETQPIERDGGRFEFEFTMPTTSRLGVQVAEFAGPVTESCRPRVLVLSPNDTMQLGLSVFEAAPVCGTCPSECIESSFECGEAGTPCATDMLESLAETQFNHLKEKHELQLEIAQLKAKLQFQSERKKLQAEIDDLRHENTALQLQLVFSEKVHETQSELAVARAEIARLAQRSSELEAQIAKSRPAGPTLERTNVAERPNTVERR